MIIIMSRIRFIRFIYDGLIHIKHHKLKLSRGKLKELFCRAVVFRSDCKKFWLSQIRLLSVSWQQQIDN